MPVFGPSGLLTNGGATVQANNDGSVSITPAAGAPGTLLQFAGVGVSAPASLLHVATNTNGGIIVDSAGGVPDLLFYRYQGTHAAPTAVAQDNSLGLIEGYGYDGSAVQPAGGIEVKASAAFSAGSSPGYVRILTTPSGSNASVERLRVFASGGVSINNTTDPGAGNLSVTGSGLFNSGNDVNSSVTIGSGYASPTAERAAVLQINVPSNGTFLGTAEVRYQRAGANVWTSGVDFNVAGTKGSTADFYWFNGTSYVMSVSTAGALTTASGITVQAGGLTVTAGNIGIGSAASNGIGVYSNVTTGHVQLYSGSAIDTIGIFGRTGAVGNAGVNYGVVGEGSAGSGTQTYAVSVAASTVNRGATTTNFTALHITTGAVPPTGNYALYDDTTWASSFGTGGVAIRGGGAAITGTTPLSLTQSAATSGSPNAISVTAGAHTTLAIAEVNDVNLNLARTVNFTSGGGTIATQRAVLIQAPTYTATTNAVTLTSAPTVAITGPPVAGTNVTITYPAAFVVASGNVGIGTYFPTAQVSITGANGAAGNPGVDAIVSLLVNPGNGGNGNAVGATGGAGGTIALNGGTGGGSATSGSGSTNTGGVGGSITLQAGTGGNAQANSTNTAGAGGALGLESGAGGSATGAGTDTGGAGGQISITAGNAGLGGNANGGRVTISTGAKTGTGLKPLVELDAAGDIPTTAVLQSGAVGFRYVAGGALIAYVNNAGTIKSLSLGTPA